MHVAGIIRGHFVWAARSNQGRTSAKGLLDLRRTFICLLLTWTAAATADVTYVVVGLDEALTANVQSHVSTMQFGPQARFRPRDRDKIVAAAEADARAALRPFGYYAPEISTRVIQHNDRSATIELAISPGPPIRIASAEITVTGPGAGERQFRAWLRDWPLPEGSVLIQPTWEDARQDAIVIGNERGYLGAEFVRHAIEIDLEQNTARLVLELDTGPRYVMGDVDFGDHGLKPGILEYIPRFDKGDFYTARLVSRFRTDLWRTGYFDDITVREIERPDLDPPAVDFDVSVANRNPKSLQRCNRLG